MLSEQSTPAPLDKDKQEIAAILQQSLEAHLGEELHDIEHEDLQHYGESLSTLTPLPFRRP